MGPHGCYGSVNTFIWAKRYCVSLKQFFFLIDSFTETWYTNLLCWQESNESDGVYSSDMYNYWWSPSQYYLTLFYIHSFNCSEQLCVILSRKVAPDFQLYMILTLPLLKNRSLLAQTTFLEMDRPSAVILCDSKEIVFFNESCNINSKLRRMYRWSIQSIQDEFEFEKQQSCAK